jgi:hypothetical protein
MLCSTVQRIGISCLKVALSPEPNWHLCALRDLPSAQLSLR